MFANQQLFVALIFFGTFSISTSQPPLCHPPSHALKARYWQSQVTYCEQLVNLLKRPTNTRFETVEIERTAIINLLNLFKHNKQAKERERRIEIKTNEKFISIYINLFIWIRMHSSAQWTSWTYSRVNIIAQMHSFASNRHRHINSTDERRTTRRPDEKHTQTEIEKEKCKRNEKNKTIELNEENRCSGFIGFAIFARLNTHRLRCVCVCAWGAGIYRQRRDIPTHFRFIIIVITRMNRKKKHFKRSNDKDKQLHATCATRALLVRYIVSVSTKISHRINSTL